MDRCIICRKAHQQTTIEHIVPRSLGNIHYILRKGKVCRSCNNGFARCESAVLNSADWLRIRQENGVAKKDLKPHTEYPSSQHLRRFMMKVAYESLYQSRPTLLESYDFEPLRQELAHKKTICACDLRPDNALKTAKRLPGLIDNWRLSNNDISLTFNILDDTFYFCFQYGSISNVLIVTF